MLLADPKGPGRCWAKPLVFPAPEIPQAEQMLRALEGLALRNHKVTTSELGWLMRITAPSC